MKYEIINTGSDGNAVVINDIILIDCGVTYKALKPYVDKLKLVLLTHSHGDHFRSTTVRRLAAERPTLRWAGGLWMTPLLVGIVGKRNIDILPSDGRKIDYKLFTVKSYSTTHNAENCAYSIEFKNGERLFYATDCNNLNGIEAKGYDLYMVEANYTDEEIAERIRSKEEQGLFAYEKQVVKNHLSKKKAENWLYDNMSANSEYILMHGHKE